MRGEIRIVYPSGRTMSGRTNLEPYARDPFALACERWHGRGVYVCRLSDVPAMLEPSTVESVMEYVRGE